MRNRIPPRATGSVGFTLLEILLVVAIIALIIGVSLPATGWVAGQKVTRAGYLLRDQLDAARLAAISRSAPVDVHLCETTNASGRTATALIYTTAAGNRALVRPVPLPDGVSVMSQSNLSALGDLPQTNVVLPNNRSVSSRRVRFYPSGAVDFPADTPLYFTVADPLRATPPNGNFATVAVDPVTGRTVVYRP
ncbi:MAG TPA: prepilin-type N-terminal cleavage/methylation domain-containing protein [Terrimicrobiaceae bacterium]|nr:prepilin-type N-terminal cleavage/methylation domain-containing protein [Terrimicrobiaceae bacterium]